MTKNFLENAKELGFNDTEAQEIWDALESHHYKRAMKKDSPLLNFIDKEDYVIVYAQTEPVPRVNYMISLKLIAAYWNDAIAQEQPQKPCVDGIYYQAYSLTQKPKRVYNENPVKPGTALTKDQLDPEYSFDFAKISLRTKALIKIAIVNGYMDNSTREKRGDIIQNYLVVTEDKFEQSFNFKFARVVQMYNDEAKYRDVTYLIISNFEKVLKKNPRPLSNKDNSNNITVKNNNNIILAGVHSSGDIIIN